MQSASLFSLGVCLLGFTVKKVNLKTCLLVFSIMDANQLEDLLDVSEEASAVFSERTDPTSLNQDSQRVEERYSCNLCARNFISRRGLGQHICCHRNKAQENAISTRM